MSGATKCECRGAPYKGCGLLFASEKAFDEHRIGAYDNRRCLTVIEMLQAGMRLTGMDLWAMPKQAVAVPIKGVGLVSVPGEELAAV